MFYRKDLLDKDGLEAPTSAGQILITTAQTGGEGQGILDPGGLPRRGEGARSGLQQARVPRFSGWQHAGWHHRHHRTDEAGARTLQLHGTT